LRITAIDPALQAIRARPLFGWGLLSDSSVLSAIIGKQNFVDDTYLSLAVEVGLVGLGAFLLLALSILGATRRGWGTPLGLALLIAVTGVLAMGVFASIFQVTQGYAAFFVLAALALISAVRGPGTGQPAAAT
jgi:O-antigen ligase